MAGSLIDLDTPELSFPNQIVVDSNVIIDWLRASFEVAGDATRVELRQHRAVQLFQLILASNAVGMVTSTSFNEVFHFLVKAKYRSEISNHLADLAVRYPHVSRYDWFHLYKARGDLMGEFVEQLDEWRQTLVASGLMFLQPSDLGPILSGRSHKEDMIRVMGHYSLDTSDAAIFLEAQRAGVMNLVTADVDLHRAQLDFNVYSWL